MADIKISELEPTTDLEGLYTIGSDKNNLSKKVSLQFLKDAANYANEQGDYAKEVGDTVNGNVGVNDYPAFSASASYSAGDIVRYNGTLYQFTANHAASAWNGNDVKATSINAITSGKLTELESKLGFQVIFTLYGESYGTYGTYNFPLKAGQTYYLSLIENKNNTIQVYYEKQDGTRISIGQLVLGAEPKEWVCPEDAIGIYFGSNGLCKISIYADALKQDVERNANKANENAESIRKIVNTYGHYINNAEWSEVIVDAEERVLLGIRKDGVVVIGCGLEVPNNEIPEVFVFKVADKENRKEIKIDKEERIISFIDEQDVYNMELPFKVNSIILQDGNIFSSFKDLEEKLNLDKRYATIEDVEKTGGVYDCDIPRLYVESESLSPNAETDEIGGLNLSKNEVDCKYIYVSPTIRFTDTGTIAYQGKTT